MAVKMYCVLSAEAVKKMERYRGKICTQAGHAYLKAFIESSERFPEISAIYTSEGSHQYKITLVVQSEDELIKLADAYRDRCGVALITDKGFTIFDKPTMTCVGIGPICESFVDADLSSLKLFK